MKEIENTKQRETAKEGILYLVFGVLTTIINIAVYYTLSSVLDLGVIISNIIAWFISVFFAYITNRKYVFHSDARDIASFFRELIGFFAGRFCTGILDTLLMYVSVDLLDLNDLIMKVIANIIVIVTNYCISKFLVFRKKKVCP